FTASLPSLRQGIGADTVNVRATDGPLIIEGQNGDDIVTIGSANGVQDIKGTVRINNAQGSTALTVSDQGNPFGRTAVTLGTGIGGDNKVVGKITNLAPAEISYDFPRIRSLQITGGSGGNTFNVTDTVTNNTFLLFTKLNSGSGNDTVNVRHTSPAAILALDGGGGNDIVNLGSASDSSSVTTTLQGSVHVANTGGPTTLNVNNQGPSKPRSGTLARARLSGKTRGQLFGFGSDILFTTPDVAVLNINAGPLGNSFDIDDTVAGTTTFNTGTGTDHVEIRGTTKPL